MICAHNGLRRVIAVKVLPGLVDYRRALDLQRRIVERKAAQRNAYARASPPLSMIHGSSFTETHSQNKILAEEHTTEHPWPDVLLLLQHPPTYTVGRRIRGTTDTEGGRLRKLGADYVEVNTHDYYYYYYYYRNYYYYYYRDYYYYYCDYYYCYFSYYYY